MTQDEIIEMVKQAGIRFRKNVFYSGYCDGVHGDELVAFANLVAQHEREACVKAIEEQIAWDLDDPESTAIKAIRARGQA